MDDIFEKEVEGKCLKLGGIIVRIIDHVFMALKRLRMRLFETLVIVLAIGLGTGVICTALALTFTYIDQMRDVGEQLYYRQITISSGRHHMYDAGIRLIGDRMPVPARFTLQTAYDLKENCPDVEYILFTSGTSLTISEPDDPEELMRRSMGLMSIEDYDEWLEERAKYELDAIRTTPDYFAYHELELKEGSFFTDMDVREGNRVVVLGPQAAERWFPGENPIGQELPVIGQEPFTVIGVLNIEIDEDAQHVSYQDRRLLRGGLVPISSMWFGDNPMNEEIPSISAVATSSERGEAAESQIRSFLEQQFTEGFSINSPMASQREMQPIIRRGQIIAGFAASLGLLIAAFNILNLMMARVLKRTKEIGILTALGSDKKSILHSFLWEAFLMGFLGALFGFALAMIGQTVMVSMIPYFPIRIDYRTFLSAVGISGLVSFIFGVYPALQAARVNPVEALRTE